MFDEKSIQFYVINHILMQSYAGCFEKGVKISFRHQVKLQIQGKNNLINLCDLGVLCGIKRALT